MIHVGGQQSDGKLVRRQQTLGHHVMRHAHFQCFVRLFVRFLASILVIFLVCIRESTRGDCH